MRGQRPGLLRQAGVRVARGGVRKASGAFPVGPRGSYHGSMRRDRPPDGPDDRLVVAGLGVAALGPLVVASLLVIVRDHMARSNAALVFVIVVVLVSAIAVIMLQTVRKWALFHDRMTDMLRNQASELESETIVLGIDEALRPTDAV